MIRMYVLACGLLACAIVLDIAGKNQYSFSARYQAQGLQAHPLEPGQIRCESRAALTLGDRLVVGGMVASVGGVALWIVSAILGRMRQRRLTPVPPLVLAFAYMLLLFICA